MLYELERVRPILESAIRAARASMELAPSLQAGEAFAERLRSGDLPVNALARDPLLPPSFLPSNWPGNEPRDAFKKWNSEYSERYMAFVRSAMNDGRKETVT